MGGSAGPGGGGRERAELGKRPYAVPRLTEYGRLARLTAKGTPPGKSGSQLDGVNTRKRGKK